MRPYKISKELENYLFELLCHNNCIDGRNNLSSDEMHDLYLKLKEECATWAHLNDGVKDRNFYAINIRMFKDIYLIYNSDNHDHERLYYKYDAKNRWKWWFIKDETL